jgi:heme exporter protein A
MMTIEFSEVSQSFHGRQIFGPLTVKLHSGRITAVTGFNGSGKSTFLKLAGHLLLPTKGEVTVSADDGVLKQADLRAHLAMVTPEMRFYDRLTARENMDFFLGLRGISLDDAAYRQLLERVELSAKAVAASYTGEFSTGMGQRLKMAVLLACRADIWLLDEPGANLDEAGRAMVAQEMRAAAERGVLVAVATNDPGEEALADEVISLAGR